MFAPWCSAPLLLLVASLAVSLAERALAAPIGGPAPLALEAQREAFREAFAHAERGQWRPVEPHLALLADYVLYPELRAAYLGANLRRLDADEIERFLAEHPGHPAAAELERRWLRELMRREEWPAFLRVYDRLGGSTDAVLRCQAARARLIAGSTDRSWEEEALSLWHSGSSRPNACDPVFDRLRSGGILQPADIRARLDLSLAARQFGLAAFLARELAAADRERVARWQAMAADPASELARHPLQADSEDEWERVRYGLLVHGNREPETAYALALRLVPAYGRPAEGADVLRRLALAAARRLAPAAARLLADLPPEAADDPEVADWRLRLALAEQDWPAVLRLAGRVADPRRAAYWQARAYEELGQMHEASAAFERAAGGRDLYALLAAERNGRGGIGNSHRPTADDARMLAALEADPAFIHARELYFVGLDSRARSAWNRAIAGLDPARLEQAARLADRWGWHSRAVSTAAGAGLLDDLELRYPLAWRDQFLAIGGGSRAPVSWVYGVARNESLFIPDIASHAGAVGLMQLMPATAREVAAELGMPYRGLATLIDPEANLRLGVRYLERMLARFDGHVAVATAAYNAGPGRVGGWLPADGELPADVWIELIPFDETRGFVHRVLASKAIFHWRLNGGEELSLRELLGPVASRGR